MAAEPAASAATTALATVRHAPTDLSTPELARVLVQSGFFADTREVAQAIAKILYGRELGLGPVTAMMAVHVIQGKPAPSAGLLAALIKRSGRYTYRVRALDATQCDLEFFERTAEGSWESVGHSTFTVEDARAAGALSGRNAHTWRSYARNMLFARALSNGARWFTADIFGGAIYVPEELDAAVDGEGNLAPAPAPAPPSAPPPTAVVVTANGAAVDTTTGEVLEPPAAPPTADTPGMATLLATLRARADELLGRLDQLGVATKPLPATQDTRQLTRWVTQLEARLHAAEREEVAADDPLLERYETAVEAAHAAGVDVPPPPTTPTRLAILDAIRAIEERVASASAPAPRPSARRTPPPRPRGARYEDVFEPEPEDELAGVRG